MFEHFLKFQNGEMERYPSYQRALYEITVQKKKITHWIWYIIPYDQPSRQHKDLFVLNEKNVSLYLQNEQLRNNYIEIMNAIHDVLEENTIEEYEHIITQIDLKKIYGSAVLFKNNCPSSYDEVISVCNKVIYILTDYIKLCKKETIQKKLHLQLVKKFKSI